MLVAVELVSTPTMKDSRDSCVRQRDSRCVLVPIPASAGVLEVLDEAFAYLAPRFQQTDSVRDERGHLRIAAAELARPLRQGLHIVLLAREHVRRAGASSASHGAQRLPDLAEVVGRVDDDRERAGELVFAEPVVIGGS